MQDLNLLEVVFGSGLYRGKYEKHVPGQNHECVGKYIPPLKRLTHASVSVGYDVYFFFEALISCFLIPGGRDCQSFSAF